MLKNQDDMPYRKACHLIPLPFSSDLGVKLATSVSATDSSESLAACLLINFMRS